MYKHEVICECGLNEEQRAENWPERPGALLSL